MFTGMSIRVAQELGLHRQRPTIFTGLSHFSTNDEPAITTDDIRSLSSLNLTDNQEFEHCSQVLLFWSVFVQDVMLANGTGRVPAIKISEVSIRMPTGQDVAIVRGSSGGLSDTATSSAFPTMVRMMLEYAKSIELLNTPPASSITSVDEAFRSIHRIKHSILSSYGTVPQELLCGATQYRHASNSGHATSYLILHLYFHMQVAFLTTASRSMRHTGSFKTQSSSNQGLGLNEPAAFATSTLELEECRADDELYRRAIKSIVDILTIARFVNSRPLQAMFFLNQSFFNAACAYLGDMLRFQHHISQQFRQEEDDSAFPLPSHSSIPVVCDLNEVQGLNGSPADDYLAILATANYRYLRQAIKDMAQYYAGADWVDAVLDQREIGIRDVDLSIVSEHISTYVRLHDLRRTQYLSTEVREVPASNARQLTDL